MTIPIPLHRLIYVRPSPIFRLAIPTRSHRPNPRILLRNPRTPTSRHCERPIQRLVNIRLIAVLLSHILITHTLARIQIRARAPQRPLRSVSARAKRQRVGNIPGAEIVGVADHVDVLPKVGGRIHVEYHVDLAG